MASVLTMKWASDDENLRIWMSEYDVSANSSGGYMQRLLKIEYSYGRLSGMSMHQLARWWLYYSKQMISSYW